MANTIAATHLVAVLPPVIQSVIGPATKISKKNPNGDICYDLPFIFTMLLLHGLIFSIR